MVYTRSMAKRARLDEIRRNPTDFFGADTDDEEDTNFNYGDDNEETCDDCARSSVSNFSNMYSDNDRCKRHRRPDDAEYTQSVSSYRRRLPRS